ncbi:MAG TPA: four helix bundle protein, partial [Phototrophicaceae bacterium]|nr:four helix bundle protein [Phototrophicaceae bacterium]
SNPDFVRFLYIAQGSTNELETHLVIANDLGFLPNETHQRLEPQIEEIRRMLNGLIHRLNSTK